MIKLFCGIVGVPGRVLSVDIDVNQSVGDLKKAIQVKKPNELKNVDADELQLFLAKTTDGKWLSDEDLLS
ncbi:unnamed protein product [Peronospora belbahrii]|uniref:Ubiquitin-like domain-containing protein n=1 Tax=Peronospora belbahrii TaxID=622444 RepID=A0AAU9L1J5_9STRA|nr:unnamed protein product [Peronospora belbahrii]